MVFDNAYRGGRGEGMITTCIWRTVPCLCEFSQIFIIAGFLLNVSFIERNNLWFISFNVFILYRFRDQDCDQGMRNKASQIFWRVFPKGLLPDQSITREIRKTMEVKIRKAKRMIS